MTKKQNLKFIHNTFLNTHLPDYTCLYVYNYTYTLAEQHLTFLSHSQVIVSSSPEFPIKHKRTSVE